MKMRYEDDRKAIVIVRDTDARSPRQDDNLGKIMAFHRNYSFSDEKHSSNLHTALFNLLEDLAPVNVNEFEDKNDEDILEEIGKYAVVLPLYLYDHSGVSIRTEPFSCKWDSGQVGIVYASMADVDKEWEGVDEKTQRENAERIMKSEISIYDDFLQGEVYGFELYEKCDKCHHGQLVDSCWGFYGNNIEENGIKSAVLDDFQYLFDVK